MPTMQPGLTTPRASEQTLEFKEPKAPTLVKAFTEDLLLALTLSQKGRGAGAWPSMKTVPERQKRSGPGEGSAVVRDQILCLPHLCVRDLGQAPCPVGALLSPWREASHKCGQVSGCPTM